MKKIILFQIIAWIFFGTFCTAQEDYEGLGGAIFDEKENIASKRILLENFYMGAADEALPLEYSLKEYAPTARRQNASTCVAHAVSNALTIMTSRKDGITDRISKDKNVFSAHYIFNQIQPLGCRAGARISEAMDLVKNQGDCYANLFEDATYNCGLQPSEAAKQQALQNRIKDYYSLFPYDEADTQKIYLTKKELAQGRPIVIGMAIPQSFYLASTGTQMLNTSIASPKPVTRHAMCVVGYDDTKGAFEIMNSWGTHWANKGFIWMKYEDYGKYVEYGYAGIIDSVSPQYPQIAENQITLTGEFAFRFPTDVDERTGNPIFTEMSPGFNGSNYIVFDWKVHDVYQLLGRAMTQYSYTYVFSIDAENKAQLHFPHSVYIESEIPDDLDAAALKKPMVLGPQASMTIPNDLTAFQSIHKGVDNIYVIYSHTEIPDIQERIKRVRASAETNINTRLKMGFADLLIPEKDIKYSTNEMGFTASSTQGIAVPIALEVVIN